MGTLACQSRVTSIESVYVKPNFTLQMNSNTNKANEQSFQVRYCCSNTLAASHSLPMSFRQMEILRQFEQQIMMQQLQIQQQQQQQQFNAALESFASMQGKANGPSRKDVSGFSPEI